MPIPTPIETDAFPWVGIRLARGDIVRISSLDALPAEAASDRQNLAERGIQSLAAVPFIVNGALVGALGFSRLRGERLWPDELITRLQLLADVFANVLRTPCATARRAGGRPRRRRSGSVTSSRMR